MRGSERLSSNRGKVIDIPRCTQGLCQKRAEEDGEGGKNGNVLLKVSNDHKHINHGARRLLLGK